MNDIIQIFYGALSWQTAVELAVIWIVVFTLFGFLQGTRGAGLIKGVLVLLVVLTIGVQLLTTTGDSFKRLELLFNRFLEYGVILLIVVFQPELRQMMGRVGEFWSVRRSQNVNTVVTAVTDAVRVLSRNQFGALIAIERQSLLGRLIDSGVQLDAHVDARLLESIFWPNNPLHDLGVVIRDDRIAAACVQFPLAEEGMLPVRFGSRHRAAVGLSQESDAIIVIVSEETGDVSIAEHGRLQHAIPLDTFALALESRLAVASEAEEDESGTREDGAPDAPAVVLEETKS